MKKKVFLTGVAAAAAVASLTLVSCGGGNTPTQTTTTTTAPAENAVDVFLNYKNTSGITFQKINGQTSHTNPIDKISYKAGDLLPAWQTYQTKLDIKLRDMSEYNEGKDDNATYEHFNTPGWTAKGQKIDLFMNSTANINKMGSESKAVNLRDYIDAGKMPNFKAYLVAHPEIEKEISYGDNNAIYFTPYLDGYNAIERMLVIDSRVVELLLDEEIQDGLGLLTSGANSTNTKTITGAPQMLPFIDADHNYPNATTTVKIDNGTQAVDLVITQTDNIIKQQNTLLAAGTTGKALIDQFKNYLNAAFANQVGTGKTYAKLSEIFTSGKAAYNTDELIALMRVAKANPDVLFYDVTKNVQQAVTGYEEVETWFPRGEDKSRVQNLLNFGGALFGVQGMGSEKDHLYFTADGKMHDADTTKASYGMLDKLNAMYKEGLIMDDFWTAADYNKTNGKAYVNKYFAKTVDKASSFGLLMYDYTATQSAPNDLQNGLGTDKATRKSAKSGISFKNYSVQGIHPILAPLTYWATETSWVQDSDLVNANGAVNTTGKTLTRFYEENRAVKNGSWCIPSTSDNKEGAVKLMDYLFSEEGNKIHNFGPSNYWDMGTILGESAPVLKPAILADYSATGGDIWDYFRGVLGTTQGVGHYRPSTLDYQSTNEYAKDGYTALAHAVSVGVQKSSLCSTTYTWSTTVPVSCYPTIDKTTAKQYIGATDFWAQDKLNATSKGWVNLVKGNGLATEGVVVEDGTSYTATLNQLMETYVPKKNKVYLYKMANSVSPACIPSEAQQD